MSRKNKKDPEQFSEHSKTAKTKENSHTVGTTWSVSNSNGAEKLNADPELSVDGSASWNTASL